MGGTSMDGNTTVSFTDSEFSNTTYSYPIYRPTVQNFYIKVDFYTDAMDDGTQAAVKQAIINDALGQLENPRLGFAQIVYADRFRNSIFDQTTVPVRSIQIALDEDKKIETNKVIETKAERRIVKMNADAYERINNTEKYYEAMQTTNYPNEEKNYYNVENKIRNAWVVVITYEDNFENVEERYTEGKYSYFVDCTTGEIIGGDIMDYIESN